MKMLEPFRTILIGLSAAFLVIVGSGILIFSIGVITKIVTVGYEFFHF
jgi:hypothetical protein